MNLNGELVLAKSPVTDCKLYNEKGEYCVLCDGSKKLRNKGNK